MPARREGAGCGELIVVPYFLSGLAPTVATATRFLLWNPDELAIPVHPRGLEVGDLPGAEVESSTD